MIPGSHFGEHGHRQDGDHAQRQTAYVPPDGLQEDKTEPGPWRGGHSERSPDRHPSAGVTHQGAHARDPAKQATRSMRPNA